MQANWHELIVVRLLITNSRCESKAYFCPAFTNPAVRVSLLFNTSSIVFYAAFYLLLHSGYHQVLANMHRYALFNKTEVVYVALIALKV